VSGADLIGPVPAHWTTKPLRLVGRLLKGKGGSKEDVVEEGVPCVRYGDLYTTHNNFIEQARTYLTEGRAQDYTPIAYGDVLFAASGETIEEIGKSAVNLLHGARCGGDVVILRPTEPMHARFLGYATDAAPVAAQKSLAGRGTTVKHIYPDELREVVIAVPPLREQQMIADFLDCETARLDALVAAKQRLLELLSEKRKALIVTAVTRGLDPNVRLRDSGAPWLPSRPRSHHRYQPQRPPSSATDTNAVSR
jgi:type I restriction enzyme S subunit